MLGWAGTVFCVTGALFTAHKRRRGFLFTSAGCVLWVAEAAKLGIYSLALVELVFAVISLYGYLQWCRKGV